MFKKNTKEAKEYTGILDEIKEQQLKAKDMSFKGRLSYFWYYYKIHTIIAVIVIIFGGSFIYDMATAKDYNFYGILLNAYHIDADAMEDAFGEYAKLDMENYECFIDTSTTLSYQTQSEYDLATSQKLIALVQTKDLDAVVFDAQVFDNFSFNGMFMDLRNVLTEEELAEYEGNIYYIDYAEVKKAENADDELLLENQENAKATYEEIAAAAQTHRYPETMKEPIPVGIFMDSSPFAKKTQSYDPLVPIYGFIVTTQRTDTAKQYLEFLWDESVPFEHMVSSSSY